MTTPPTNSDRANLDRANSDRAEADTAWAAEQLRLLPPLEAAAARPRLLRELRTHEFLPPPDWQICARLVLEQPLAEMSPAEAISTGRRDALREQVETFAAEFFDLPPDARRARWRALMALARPHAPLAQRLALLGRGLDVDTSTHADAGARPHESSAQVAELRQLILRMFVLRPPARAELSLAFHERVQGAPSAWEKAAKLLERLYPDVANLNGWLVEELKNWSKFDARGTRVQRTRLQRARTQEPAMVRASLHARNLILGCIGIGLGIFLIASTWGTRISQSSRPVHLQSLQESIRKLQELETKPKSPAPAETSLDAPPPIIDVIPPVPPPPPSMREDVKPKTPKQTPDQTDTKKNIRDGDVETPGAGEQSPR